MFLTVNADSEIVGLDGAELDIFLLVSYRRQPLPAVAQK
jgi:hypothetical protein